MTAENILSITQEIEKRATDMMIVVSYITKMKPLSFGHESGFIL